MVIHRRHHGPGCEQSWDQEALIISSIHFNPNRPQSYFFMYFHVFMLSHPIANGAFFPFAGELDRISIVPKLNIITDG